MSENTPAQKALLLGLYAPDDDAREAALSLEELGSLLGNLGIAAAETLSVRVRAASPRFATGRGKALELIERARTLGCDLIAFDAPLSPAQQRAWERESGLTVVDRHEIILDIFAQRAHTREAALQVELARLEYELPRLKRAWTHFSRQRGGGVTQRGEGETQLQLDRRLLRERIRRLKGELETVVKRRALQRKHRERVPLASAAIVGYTNAGKSSLLNRLARASVLAADKLFATLDPTTRKLAMPTGQPLLLTDTVGFVRKLPPRLVEAFKATLEEAVVSDFLIHVIDASSPEAEVHAATTRAVLRELGADDKPVLTVYNKTDAVDDPLHLAGLRADDPDCVFVSARTGEGFERLLAALERMMAATANPVDLLIPHDAYKLVSLLHAEGLVLFERPRADGTLVRANLPPRLRTRYAPYRTQTDLLDGQTTLL